MVSIPSLNYNAAMSNAINAKENTFLKGVLSRYKAEGNAEEIKRYEEAIVYREEVIVPDQERLAKHWAKIAGIPDSKFGQILSPEEVKFYEKDRSGGATGFPEDLFPKGSGLDTYS
jgi:hypothetical protein